jgi:NADH dehydrogenase
MKHGERAGDNIARCIQGKELLPFTYPGLGQVASLGIGKGAAEVWGLQFTGWPGWFMRMGFFLWFMPSSAKALRVSLDWLTLPLTGRRMQPMVHTPPDRGRRSDTPAMPAEEGETVPFTRLQR